MKKLLATISIVPIAVCLSLTSALPATNTATFTVAATVSAYCTVSVGSNISGLSVTTTSGTAIMTVICTNGTAWTVGLAGSQDASDGVFRMSDGDSTAKYIRYTIGATSSDSTVTGKPAAVGSASSKISGTGAGASQSVTLTATAATGVATDSITYAAPGSYSDTVTATVTF